jgi:Zn finger protein HypA/HybF involved in hydrogenase expression
VSDGHVTQLARTLDQELLALVRGASLECVVCGEFVMRYAAAVACPECRSVVADGLAVPELALPAAATAGERPIA